MKRDYFITQEKIDRYGEINGDNDIIHYDVDYARERGFKAPLAHGLMVQGYASAMAAEKYGADWFTRGEIHVKFVGPLYPDETITVEIDDDGKLHVAAGDRTCIVGTAKLRDAA
ncbi:MaoC family dehydratase [Thermocrispum municipale]|jgi:3-hydroxybutyryl-CoA dehydratase|uniref:MaoC family dehydratase n=1 Tax=Thermocrispum municipale TaxID=37926 RepID=UPI0003F6606E|nr:MaoC family dehydratase [Thermocrispum municipale]